jgi:hypothetical protein
MFKDPVLVIGAPRSGTKMLRELLKLHPDIDGALYEKERIWCYGNRQSINCLLKKSDLTDDIRRYVRDHFKRSTHRSKGKWIVDKNVANTLRVEFVKEIFPNSPIIHIIRDGRDAVYSAMERWRRPADYKYIIKNRAFPIEELPYFFMRQVKWQLEKIFQHKKHVGWWGPKFHDSEMLVQKFSLIEVCGIQWSRCVESFLSGVKMDARNIKEVRYEDILANPVYKINEIYRFLNLDLSAEVDRKIAEYVQTNQISWKEVVSDQELALLMPHIQRTLVKLKYINEPSL